MMFKSYLFWTLLVVVSVHCFQRLQQQTRTQTTVMIETPQDQQLDSSKRNVFPPKIRDQVLLQGRRMFGRDWPERQTKECTCPPEHGAESEDEDVISNVGEAAFAMLGSIWAQEESIPTSILFPDAANNENDVWIGDQHQVVDKDLIARARIRAVMEELANHPYADEEGNLLLDSISTNFLQHI